MKSKSRKELLDERNRLRNELAERNAAIPIHSIRPHQLIEIEELEERIADIESLLAKKSTKSNPGRNSSHPL